MCTLALPTLLCLCFLFLRFIFYVEAQCLGLEPVVGYWILPGWRIRLGILKSVADAISVLPERSKLV